METERLKERKSLAQKGLNCPVLSCNAPPPKGGGAFFDKLLYEILMDSTGMVFKRRELPLVRNLFGNIFSSCYLLAFLRNKKIAHGMSSPNCTFAIYNS